MTSRDQILSTITVTRAQDLRRLWSAVMGDGGFGRRTLWVVILDDDGRPAPVVVPIDDVPVSPTPTEVESFGQMLEHLKGFGAPVLLLSRPGLAAVQEHDRLWAQALAPFTPRWPVHLATEDAFGRCVVTDLSEAPGAIAS